MEILVGADPEIFVRRVSDKSLVSAHGMVKGTKKEPLPVKNGAVQVDGMALEFNINPASNRKEFRDNINSVMGQLKAMIGPEYEFDLSPTAHFGKEMIEAQPEEARILGCDPDYNAYTGEANPRPNGDVPFRTASGHIHIGWTSGMDPHDPEHFEACRMLTKQLDIMLAPISRLWDKDNERRKLYGDLGAFRPKSFGVEYRVLSNAWLRHKETISLVYDAAIKATQDLLNGKQRYAKVRKGAAGFFNSEIPWDWYYPYDAWLFETDLNEDTHWKFIRKCLDEANLEADARKRIKKAGLKPPVKLADENEVVNAIARAARVLEGGVVAHQFEVEWHPQLRVMGNH